MNNFLLKNKCFRLLSQQKSINEHTDGKTTTVTTEIKIFTTDVTYIHTQGFYKTPFHKDHSANINIKA